MDFPGSMLKGRLMLLTVVKTSGFLGLAMVGLVGVALPARASVIVQFTSGVSTAANDFFGQKFTTPSGGPWDDITFNFFSDPGVTPVAVGTAYIFGSLYSGTPSGLSGASDLATSTGILSGSYVFSPTFTLQPNTQYFLYEDTVIPQISGDPFITPFTGYGTPSASTTFGGFGSTDFRVSGDIANGVPEPTTMGLCVLGGVILLARRQKRQSPVAARTDLTTPTQNGTMGRMP